MPIFQIWESRPLGAGSIIKGTALVSRLGSEPKSTDSQVRNSLYSPWRMGVGGAEEQCEAAKVAELTLE